MCKKSASIILEEMSQSLSGWNKAIYDTEQKIGSTKRRLAELKAVKTLFEERRDSGEPFPGESERQNEAGA